jgi:hypothetical protein
LDDIECVDECPSNYEPTEERQCIEVIQVNGFKKVTPTLSLSQKLGVPLALRISFSRHIEASTLAALNFNFNVSANSTYPLNVSVVGTAVSNDSQT